jgi:hypothetical protein
MLSYSHRPGQLLSFYNAVTIKPVTNENNLLPLIYKAKRSILKITMP